MVRVNNYMFFFDDMIKQKKSFKEKSEKQNFDNTCPIFHLPTSSKLNSFLIHLVKMSFHQKGDKIVL